MKSLLSLLSLVLFVASIPAFAFDCNAVVNDQAHILNVSAVSNAASYLVNKGADPRIITVNGFNGTPENLVSQAQGSCNNWKSVSGGVKNNLVVFVVFPAAHKVGLFVGQEFGKAINGSVIRSQFMIPAFRDGDFTRGVVNGIKQASVQVEAFQTSALHPTALTTVVNDQATDYSGLWKWLDGLLILGFLIGVFGLFIYFRNRRQAAKDAQQDAINARNQAAEFVNDNPGTYAVDLFTTYSNSESYNPDTNGLSEGNYRAIEAAYKRIINYGYKVYPATPATNTVQTKYAGQQTTTTSSTPAQSTTVINRTTYVDNGPSYGYVPPLVSPIIIEESTPVIVEEPAYVGVSDSTGYSGGSSSSGWSDSSKDSSDSSSSSSWSDSSSSSSWSDSGSSFSDSSSSSSFGDSGSSGGDSGGSSSW